MMKVGLIAKRMRDLLKKAQGAEENFGAKTE